jgi:hypothetical protein
VALSDEHKAALAKGRRESRIIKNYLKALQSRRPGRPVTADGVRKRLATIDERLATEEDALKLLDLHQEKLDAEETLHQLEARQDLTQLEKQFIDVAKDYSERKGISYMAWRQVGVAAAVLKEAGIPRTRRS